MTYASQQDLIERAGLTEITEVADRDGNGVPDPDVIEAALFTADERINSYLAVRYRTPLARVAPVVIGWAVSIARYFLHRDGAPDHVVRDYRDTIAELKEAAAGRLAVPDAEGLSPIASSSGATSVDGTPPAFTKENMEGWL